MFTSYNKQFKTICESFVFFIFLSKWRHFYWMTVNKRWLNELVFYFLFKKFIYDVSIRHFLCYFYLVLFCLFLCLFICLFLPKIYRHIFFFCIHLIQSC